MRNHYIDLLKGVAALNIVFIHTVFNSGYAYVPDWVRAASLAIDVPFFFFLSGWAVASMPAIRFQKTFASLWRIYMQWALFVAFTFAAMFVVAALTPIPLGGRRAFAASFLGNLVLVNPDTPLPFSGVMGGGWFLIVYFAVVPAMSLAIAMIRRWTASLRPILALLFICVIGFVRVQAGAQFFFFDQFFLCYSVFFLLGFLQSTIIPRAWQSLVLMGLSLLALWGALAVRGAHLIDMQGLKFPPTLAWACFSLLGIVVAMSFKRWQFRVPGRGPLNWVGKNALPFFFTNAVAASITIFIEPLISMPWVPKLVVCYLITLAITASLVVFFKQLYAWVAPLAARAAGAVVASVAFPPSASPAGAPLNALDPEPVPGAPLGTREDTSAR